MADLETPTTETPQPDTPPAPAPQPPAAPEPTPPAEPDDGEIPDGAIEQGGQVMVPLAALRAERQQVKSLKDKAAQVDQIAAWYQQSKPYIDFLQAHPDLLTRPQPQSPPTPAQPPPPPDDGAAEQLAKTLDLYTPEGKPDAARAKVLLSTVETLAEQKAQAAIKPIESMTLQERAQSHYQQALAAVAPNGARVDPQVLAHIWQQGDPRVLATPQGAAAAFALALGMQSMVQQQQIQPPQTLPVVTEPPGSRLPGRQPLTELDQRIIAVRGIDPKKYADIAKSFRPGEANTLESD